MSLLRKFANGLRALLRRQLDDKELDEELRGFVDTAAAEKVKTGMSRARAMREAKIEMGSPESVKEGVRAVGWETKLETVWRDVRFAVHIMRKMPVITTVALLSLALGIGANTAIFSLIDTVMLRMLPVQNPEQLVQVARVSPSSSEPFNSFTNPIWEQLRDRQDVFSGIFAWWANDFDLSDGGEVQNVHGLYASGAYFTTLGTEPLLGRVFTPSDDHRGCSGAVVLGYGFWRQHYGAAESAIGSLLRLNGHYFPVIGVAPPGFFGMQVGDRFDVALPLCAEAIIDGENAMLDVRGAWWLQIVGRLKPGVTQRQAAARLKMLAPQIFAATAPPNWPAPMLEKYRQTTLATMPAATGLSHLRRQYERPLEMLMVIVGLVLLIACANIASLMLARSAARQKEIAVRLSLGASRTRLIRQMLTESIVFAAAGTLLGVLFAHWSEPLLVRSVSTSAHKVFLTFSMDGRVFTFTAAVAILTGLLFGILPALRATRVSLTSAMKGDRAEDASGHSSFRSERWIVGVQLALSLILLVGTGLFLRSFRNLITMDPGFDRNDVLLANINIHNAKISPAGRAVFFNRLLNRLKTIPGVIDVSQSWFTPIQGFEWNEDIQVNGEKPASEDDFLVWFNWVSAGYFANLRTPLQAGRDFDSRDTATSTRVAVVNEAFVQKFFPKKNPIGEFFRLGDQQLLAKQPIQIIGIVSNAKYVSLKEDFLPTAYIPLSQMQDLADESAFEIRTAANPASIVPAVRDAVAAESNAVSLQFITLAHQVDNSVVQERLLATLSTFFGGLALLLTAIGLYGVMAYAVTRRQKEIGIRMALGAKPAAIVRLIMRDVALLLVVGIAAGILGAFWMTRFVQQLLFDLQARDVETMAAAVALLVGVTLLAGYLPARRAAHLDPMQVLREE